MKNDSSIVDKLPENLSLKKIRETFILANNRNINNLSINIQETNDNTNVGDNISTGIGKYIENKYRIN